MENQQWFAVQPSSMSNAIYVMLENDLALAERRASAMYDHPIVKVLTWGVWHEITGCDMPSWNCSNDQVRGDLALPKYKDYQVLIISP